MPKAITITPDQRLTRGIQATPIRPRARSTASDIDTHQIAEPRKTPATRIADRGRVRVRLDALREGDVLAVGLEMPDAARGEGALATRIVDTTRERILDVETLRIAGEGTGVRLEIDPEWLQPGAYLIQVRTADASHFPLRRYVLEVE